jgi:hypothetical protein
MVNFMCQHDWALECPDIQPDISGYVCDDEINFLFF